MQKWNFMKISYFTFETLLCQNQDCAQIVYLKKISARNANQLCIRLDLKHMSERKEN